MIVKQTLEKKLLAPVIMAKDLVDHELDSESLEIIALDVHPDAPKCEESQAQTYAYVFGADSVVSLFDSQNVLHSSLVINQFQSASQFGNYEQVVGQGKGCLFHRARTQSDQNRYDDMVMEIDQEFTDRNATSRVLGTAVGGFGNAGCSLLDSEDDQ